MRFTFIASKMASSIEMSSLKFSAGSDVSKSSQLFQIFIMLFTKDMTIIC